MPLGGEGRFKYAECSSIAFCIEARSSEVYWFNGVWPVLPVSISRCEVRNAVRLAAEPGVLAMTLCLRADIQKLSCPESHSSCQIAAGDELSAKKQVVKMPPTVKPTPIRISAVSPCSYVSGRLSTKRRFAICWI